MTAAGWIIMLLSTGAVTVLFGWCIWRVLTLPAKPRPHGPEVEASDAADVQPRPPTNA